MTTTALFTPTKLGRIDLKNRIVMAPLTRSRADTSGVPSEHAPRYYADRAAGAGLVIAEATQVSFTGQGYCRTPGAHTDAQMAGWRTVVDAVHAAGGKAVLQLFHVGRVSHHLNRQPGTEAVAPSAVQLGGQMWTDQQGMQPHDPPRALETSEIAGIIEEFASAAERAVAAGFDGVEVHSANGYLLHQFLSTNVNQRTDAYGGSIPNRMRFPLEVVDAVVARIGADRIGIRLSPGHGFNEIEEADVFALYRHYIGELDGRGLAYLHVMRAFAHVLPFDPVSFARGIFSGPLIAAGGYDGATGAALVAAGGADAVAYGKAFISNPDLAERIRRGAPLTEPNQATFYTPGPEGYVDYPKLAA
jgi:N-ethylmaleimide reductase